VHQKPLRDSTRSHVHGRAHSPQRGAVASWLGSGCMNAATSNAPPAPLNQRAQRAQSPGKGGTQHVWQPTDLELPRRARIRPRPLAAPDAVSMRCRPTAGRWRRRRRRRSQITRRWGRRRHGAAANLLSRRLRSLRCFPPRGMADSLSLALDSRRRPTHTHTETEALLHARAAAARACRGKDEGPASASVTRQSGH
jgi:hypothetical protein